MNKMNKKGFTLIEMLVVIAIIAVLVSIIVPVVGNSTTKAAAATNAANLRTVMADVATKHLMDRTGYPAGTYTAVDGTITFSGSGDAAVTMTVPTAKEIKIGTEFTLDKGTQMTVVIDDTNGTVTATYGTGDAAITLEQLAEIAETGKAPTTTDGD